MNAPASPPAASRPRRDLLLLVAVLVGCALFVVLKSAQLPALVATHFDAQGKANGWMTRQQHLYFSLGDGILLPLFIVGLFALIQRLGGWGLNIPNKAYWLGPEHQAATYDFLRQRGLWLAALMAVFQAAIFKSTWEANQLRPPTLSSGEPIWLVAGFLVLILIWIAGLILRFRMPRA